MNTMRSYLRDLGASGHVRRIMSIVFVLFQDMKRCDLFKHASAMAYVTLFSLIPSLAATFTLIALFEPFLGEDSLLLMKLKELILSNLAAGSGETVIAHLESFLANLDLAKIGLTGFVGVVVSLILLLRQIEIALNRIWLVKKPRNIFRRFIYFWTFVTLGTFLIGLAVGIFSDFSLTNLLPFLGDSVASPSKSFFKSLTPWVVAFLFFILLYKVVPNCYVSLKHAAIGAVPAAILLISASRFYGLYAAHYTHYREVYGAVAAIPVFLMWLYVIWLIILLGALLSWRAQRSFELKEDMDSESPILAPLERLRNHHLQCITPNVVLLAVFQKFSEGSGSGVSGNEIFLKLNIPSPWVVEAIEVLLELGLIVRSGENDQDGGGNLSGAHYFPAYPPETLELTKLRESLLKPSRDWLSEWKPEWTVDLKPAVRLLSDGEEKDRLPLNMSELIKGLKPKVSSQAI